MRRGDDAALVALAGAGRPLGEIADASGLSLATVKRRLADPAVRAAVDEARSVSLAQASDRLAVLRVKAIDTLAALLDRDSPTVQLRAVGLVLDHAARLHDLAEIDRRIADLEAGQGGTAQHDGPDNDPVVHDPGWASAAV